MKKSGPMVLDISSDEEANFGESKKTEFDIGKGAFLGEEDCGWLSRLLEEVDGINPDGYDDDDDDDDEVVVVSEVLAKPSRKPRSESRPRLESTNAGNLSNFDDDCVVLDGDPDKPTVVSNSKVEDTKDGDCDSDDDLEIVGEKGEVACRDFPHARHLCVKFAFASTPHDAHCSQCHCYVCDSIAPCAFWGTGTAINDHCHANDKEDCWIEERKRVKKSGKPVPIKPTLHNTPPLEAVLKAPEFSYPPQHNDFLPNSVVASQIRPSICAPIRPPICAPISMRSNDFSLRSNVSMPTPPNQGRIQSSVCAPICRPQTELVSPALLPHSTHNNSVPLGNGTANAGIRNAQPLPPPLVLKRTGLNGPFLNNRRVSGSHLHGSSLQRYHPFQRIQTQSTDARHVSPLLNIGKQADTPVLPRRVSSVTGISVGRANYLPSLPQIRSRPYSSSSIRNPVFSQSQSASQPYINNDLVNSVQLQVKLPSQLSGENLENVPHLQSQDVFQPNSPFPSPTLTSPESNGIAAFGNQLHPRPMVSSHTNLGSNFQSLQAHFSPSNLLIDDHNVIQQRGNLTRNGLEMSPEDFDMDWVSILSPSNRGTEAEISQRQVAAPDNGSQLPYQAVEKQQPQDVVVEADNSSLINGTQCHFPESTKSDLDIDFDNWMLENGSFPGPFEVPMSPGWRNEFSPDPAFIDAGTGTLFDV